MSLAVVAPIRSRPLLQSPQDIADFEQDLLSEFVLARRRPESPTRRSPATWMR
ncbi:hypothetical protein NKH18_02445 [Streptomyces sp. M10(2022)]